MLYPFPEIAKISTIEERAVMKTLMLVVYIHSPTRGISISDKAWEWTVYSIVGVWRCLGKIN